MIPKTKVAEVEREEWMDSRYNDNSCVDWINGECEGGVDSEAQVSGLGTLVDHGVSLCDRSTGRRAGLDSHCILEWCLSNRDVEARLPVPQKELGSGQQQQEWRGELRPEKVVTSRPCHSAW